MALQHSMMESAGRLAALIGLALMVVGSAYAADVTELQVKAAYLFNFAKFITWPEGSLPAAGAFTICVDGGDDILRAAKALEKKAFGDRSIVVRTVSGDNALGGCRLLHLDNGWASGFRPGAVAREGLLTVGVGVDFAERGGVVGLFRTDRKLRFAINVDAAGNAGLKINSKLLNLARIVRGP